MTGKIKSSDLTHPQIKEEVKVFCRNYKKNYPLSALLTDEQLVPYQEIINMYFQPLVDDIKHHFNKVGADKNNAWEHAFWVAVRAGYIADDESKRCNYDSDKRQSLVKKSILAGLLHDIERHVGIEEHMEKGAETAIRMLKKHNLYDENIIEAIRYHDLFDYVPEGSEEYKIIFGSLFDADHLRYGLERESDFWNREERKGTKPEDVIHDYQWLYPLRDVWKTRYGKNVCKKYIEYAIAIAEHIEEVLTK